MGEVSFHFSVVFMSRQTTIDLLAAANSGLRISRCRLADHVKVGKCSTLLTLRRAARAARLFFFIQPIMLLICGVVVFTS